MPSFSDRGLGSTFFVCGTFKVYDLCVWTFKTKSNNRHEKYEGKWGDREHLEKSNADDSLTQRGRR